MGGGDYGGHLGEQEGRLEQSDAASLGALGVERQEQQYEDGSPEEDEDKEEDGLEDEDVVGEQDGEDPDIGTNVG